MAQTHAASQTPGTAAWDAIVIGSGIGGLTTAAVLSRFGHKVLVLEQYSTIGGLSHSFSRDGFRWDVGVHYLSGLAPGEALRRLLDWLCEPPVELAPIGSVFDVLHIADAEPLPLSRPYSAQILDLRERFPDEGAAIDKWFAAVREAREVAMAVVRTRAMPRWLAKLLAWWKRGARRRWCGRTTAMVASELTDNDELRAVLMAQWGDHGGRPSRASFAFHALISHSYLECGAWYPVGGASVFAERIAPGIEAAGGELRAGVRVDRVLLEDGVAVGVRTADGEELRARSVVSDIGARETVDRLLPRGHGADSWAADIRALPHGICHFSLFVGFEGDIEAAGATRANHWIYPSGEVDVAWTDPEASDPPVLFASFASLKDPSHDPGPEQRHSGELVAWAEWSAVKKWAALAPEERGADYAAFKAKAAERIRAVFASRFPELAELIVFEELATPLASASITGHREGAIYGLDVTPARMLSDALQMKTPIPGLFLSGQDAATPGIPGAMWGGTLCAASIEPKVRSLMK